ncbi:MAG: GNAT family N-acetyltransferase [Pseudomonadota bacterium]|nr:GNAT family N-acetyltransferase [Pseudomonadota bacterium]MEC8845521.1 GNAT family N-acetyltransferase [Pseudomonadota bacterium]
MVSYRINPAFDIAEVIAVLRSSGLNRPADDPARLRCMFDHADLTVGAYDGSHLIGYARALSDRAWACYLADLAVTETYQGQGVGRAMVDRIRAEIGDRVSLILLSAPAAMTYYPHIGFDKLENAFIMPRKN